MKVIGGILVIIILGALGWFYFGQKSVEPSAISTENVNPSEEVAPQEPAGMMPAMMAEIVYTDTGFTPDTEIIPVGGTITWRNDSKVDMWVASAMHPGHAVYNGTSLSEHCKNKKPNSTEIFDQCVGIKPGESWSFTFTKEGEWKYHDHITSGRYGTVNVMKIDEMTVGSDDKKAQ